MEHLVGHHVRHLTVHILRSKEPKKGRNLLVQTTRLNPFIGNLRIGWFELIRRLQSDRKAPNLDAWANDIRLTFERDGRTEAEFRTLFEWANNDPFWQTNILSPGKLRQKWDDLQLKRMAALTNGSPKSATGTEYQPTGSIF